MRNALKRLSVVVPVLILLSALLLSNKVYADSDVRTVRVGYFHLEGYQMLNQEEEKSGYCFDFLQRMKLYADWQYEYIGYESAPADVLQMLSDGEVDMVAAIAKTPEREMEFDYSEQAISTSSVCILTSSQRESLCVKGDYTTYNGLTFGAVTGSAEIQSFEAFATEKNFHYSVKLYDDYDALEKALQAGETDAAVCTSINIIRDSVMMDQFDPTPLYIIVKKGNTELRTEINHALELLEANYPSLQNDLYKKYYNSLNQSIYFTSKEQEFIDQCRAENKVFYAIMNPDRIPFSYYQNGRATGVVGDVARHIFDKTGLNIQIIEPESREDYIQMIQNGSVSICMDMLTDYNNADRYGYMLTEPYYEASSSIVTRKEFTGEPKVIAALPNSLFYQKFEKYLSEEYEIKRYNNTQECINAVLDQECDATLCLTSVAQYAAYSDEFNRLKAAVYPAVKGKLSIAIRDEENTCLGSILNTVILNTSEDYLSSVIQSYELPVRTLSFAGILYNNPVIAFLLILMVTVVFVLFVIWRIKRKQYLQERHLAMITAQEYDTQINLNIKSMKYIMTTMHVTAFPTFGSEGNYAEWFTQFLEKHVCPEDRELIRQSRAPEALKKQSMVLTAEPDTITYRLLTERGETVWIKSTNYFYQKGDEKHCSIMNKDVTKQVEAERDILLTTDALTAISNNFTGIYNVHLDSGRYEIIKASQSAEKLETLERNFQDLQCGYCKNYIAEQYIESYKKFVDPENVRQQLLANETSELTYQRIDGVWLTLRIYKGKLYSDSNLSTIWVFENASEKAHMQEELSMALNAAQQASKAKSQFLSNMSHDIRTPMNAIIGMTGIAVTHISDRSRVQDCLNKISTASQHLLSIINDILDMSRIESGKMTLTEEPVDLAELAHTMITLIQPQIKAKNQQLFIDTAGVVNEMIIGDNTKMMQIFINILSNAVKFTPMNGIIAVKIKQLQTMTTSAYADYVFTFVDNGVGMSEEFQKKVFDAFEREKNSGMNKVEGTGLGMAISRNIVDMMGGEIICESKLGKGTTFTVKLPLKLQELRGPEVKIETIRDMRALVVDDDSNSCVSISHMLSGAGMRPEWTVSSKDAIAKSQVAYELGDSYGLFILDWLMPECNGIETTRQIRRVIGDETPIFILTAYDWSDIEEEAREAGVTAFLAKPFFRSDLYSILRSITGLGDGAVPDKEQENQPDFSGKNILIVEDNEINMEIASIIIQDSGAAVHTAHNGQEALELIEKSEEGYYDFIFMDVQMPIMDGYEATRRIRELARKDLAAIPIAAMSANAFESDIKASKEAGMNDHISKPIFKNDVYSVLRKYI